MRSAFLALAALTGIVPALVRAQPAEPVVTRHELKLPGGTLAYTAEAGRIAIRDVETGEPHGYMFYTAYRATAHEGAHRPVTFIWNGGPGADSALLHFSMTGPMLAHAGALVPNPDTWLTFGDLVLVDPIGTGYSRPTEAQYGAEFYSTRGDVASVTEFVRCWRLLHAAPEPGVRRVSATHSRRAASRLPAWC
jgi:carboxypeptidase C (cathepsin A)